MPLCKINRPTHLFLQTGDYQMVFQGKNREWLNKRVESKQTGSQQEQSSR